MKQKRQSAGRRRTTGRRQSPAHKRKRRTPVGSRAGLKSFLVLLIIAGFILSTGYVVYADRYEERFIEGTVINNYDVGGMELAEAENLLRGSSGYTLRIDFADGRSEWITGESISLGYEFGDGISKMLSQQDKYRWIEGAIGETRSYTIDNGVHFDEEQLAAIVYALPELSETDQVPPTDARCVRTGEGTFAIEPESMGTDIAEEEAYACIREAIRQQKRFLNMEETGAYVLPTVTADDPELNERVAKLNRFLETTVVYNLPDGGQWTVGREMLIEWVTHENADPAGGETSGETGADGSTESAGGEVSGENGAAEAPAETGAGGSGSSTAYYIDENVIRDKCREAVAALASYVDDVHTSRTFYATDGREVTFACDPYGRQLDQAGEAEALAGYVLNCESAVRDPVYAMNSYPESLNDGTYIEVDLADQMVYLYKDGSLFYDTPCVSGLRDDPERQTITGIFKLQYKARNRTLLGNKGEDGEPEYRTFVNYWMGFSGTYGLHDATWRDEFGGDIYRYDGSHGCVNLPYAAAETIFNNVEEGTRVLVY